METNDAVQGIADKMAACEGRAWTNVQAARGLKDEFKAIADNGDAPSLLVSQYHARLVAITSAHAADLLELHHKMTESAKELGIDLPDAVPTEGEVGILSGGGR